MNEWPSGMSAYWTSEITPNEKRGCFPGELTNTFGDPIALPGQNTCQRKRWIIISQGPTLLLLEMQNALWEHNFMNSRTTSWFSINSLLLCIMKSSCWGKTADYLVICHPFLTTHITASTYLLLTFEHKP
jgi:hypothetical protein